MVESTRAAGLMPRESGIILPIPEAEAAVGPMGQVQRMIGRSGPRAVRPQQMRADYHFATHPALARTCRPPLPSRGKASSGDQTGAHRLRSCWASPQCRSVQGPGARGSIRAVRSQLGQPWKTMYAQGARRLESIFTRRQPAHNEVSRQLTGSGSKGDGSNSNEPEPSDSESNTLQGDPSATADACGCSAPRSELVPESTKAVDESCQWTFTPAGT